uniref:Mos1 transposase HTH domain-containing protein n=1 Tax=Erpetoichthys calabaricus TaxID=27687 RepID=A0A8C4RWB8_ERPCA
MRFLLSKEYTPTRHLRVIEQRVNLKFLVKLHKTSTECFQMLTTAYGNKCLSRVRVFEWHKRFSERRENLEDFNMKKVCAKMVPRVLTPEQKERCKECCVDILQQLDADPNLFHKGITCNETWIFKLDVWDLPQSFYSPGQTKTNFLHQPGSTLFLPTM